jgi:hypothetical protein
MIGKVPMLLAGLSICSMTALSAPPTAATPAATPETPARVVIRVLPLQPPIAKDSKSLPPPRFCRLDEDCLAMDSRPFQMCQVSGKSCGDKLAEILPVAKPNSDTRRRRPW